MLVFCKVFSYLFYRLALTYCSSPTIARLPEYLAATHYRNPGGNPEASTPFQYGNNTPLSFYQAMSMDPLVRSSFDAQMSNMVKMERMKHQTGFATIFDFDGVVAPLVKTYEDVAVVDVGRSRGHVLEDVVKHLPGLKGRLVLEDLPEVLDGVARGGRIETVPYNFLEGEQPIKGMWSLFSINP